MPPKLIVKEPHPSFFFKNIGKKKYIIPSYQRYYNWDKSLIEGLFNDIVQCQELGHDLYLGTLICRTVQDGYNVIDGQQRLVTLTILLRALRGSGALADRQNKAIDRWFKETKLDHESVPYERGIQLNAADQSTFFKNVIWEGGEDPAAKRQDGSSEEKNILANLRSAFEVFKVRIEGIKKDKAKVRAICDFTMKKIEFVFIDLVSTANEAEIFEAINSKKLELTPLDLIKSYLLNSCKGKRLDEAAENWSKMINRFADLSEANKFIGYYLTAHIVEDGEDTSFIGKEYSHFKEKYPLVDLKRNPKLAIQIIIKLKKYQSFYLEMVKPKHAEIGWRMDLNDALTNILFLGYKAHIPLLLKMRSKSALNKDFAKFVQLLEVYLFLQRDLIGELPQEIKNVLHKKMKDLDNSGIKYLVKEINQECKSLLKQDAIKSLKILHGKDKSQRYVLYKVLGKQTPGLKRNISDYPVDSLEHIFPQGPKGRGTEVREWLSIMRRSFQRDEVLQAEFTRGGLRTLNDKVDDFNKRYVQSIGNLMLLTNTNNKHVQDGNFDYKKLQYKELEIKSNVLARQVVKSSQWDSCEIRKYGEWVAKQYLTAVKKYLLLL